MCHYAGTKLKAWRDLWPLEYHLGWWCWCPKELGQVCVPILRGWNQGLLQKSSYLHLRLPHVPTGTIKAPTHYVIRMNLVYILIWMSCLLQVGLLMLIVSYTTLGQLLYMTYFYMPSVKVEVTNLLVAAWSDDVIKRRLAVEISTFGGYWHVHVCSNSTKLSLHLINNIILFN